MGTHPPQRPPSSGIINTSNLSVEPDQAHTFGDFVTDVWTPALDVALSTASSYRRNLALHVVPTVGHVRLQAIDAPMLTALGAIHLIGPRQIGSLSTAGQRAGDPWSADGPFPMVALVASPWAWDLRRDPGSAPDRERRRVPGRGGRQAPCFGTCGG